MPRKRERTVTPDEITAVILTLVSAPVLTAWAINELATWNRNRRTTRKATR